VTEVFHGYETDIFFQGLAFDKALNLLHFAQVSCSLDVSKSTETSFTGLEREVKLKDTKIIRIDN
jgi:hypothetical protein